MGRAVRCQPWAGPFPRGLPPNHAGAFQRTWLSGDLRRAVGRLPVDGVVAGAADREGLTPHLGHFRRPGRLSRAGFPEAGELADLVHQHLARLPAQFASPFQEPVDQFLLRVEDRPGDVAVQYRVFLPHQWNPAEPGYQVRLAVSLDPGLEAGTQPVWCLDLGLMPGRHLGHRGLVLGCQGFSMDVSASQRSALSRHTSLASR
jgi:hypothetical protein